MMQSANAEAGHRTGVEPKGTTRVLIVEDDTLSRKVLVEYVRMLGHEPIEADNGLQALACASARQPHVILLDIGIPELDGFEVLERIKGSRDLRHIAVIVTTVREDPESIIRCMELKADGYIVKPVDPAVLKTKLHAVLSQSNARKQHQAMAASLAQTGARTQFLVAATLISLLPALALAYMVIHPIGRIDFSNPAVLAILGAVLLMVGTGYLLLLKYPMSIQKLRRYLALLAEGNLPKEIDITQEEDDLKAIGDYISSIIQQTRDRIDTIEKQTHTLIEAEAQRVMIESLGSVCHHVGQPATVIKMYLSLMAKREEEPGMQDMIRECDRAADDLGSVLEKFRELTEYRTETYLAGNGTAAGRSDERILRLPR